MHFLSSYYWDRGCRENNQDSLSVQCVNTRKGVVYMACVCDGIGGLSEGEIASGYVVEGLTQWFYEDVVPLVQSGRLHLHIRKSFFRKIYGIHQQISAYGKSKGIRMGSTCTCLVLYRKKYYIFHMGDTRVYKIGHHVSCLTRDHMADAHTLSKCIGSGKWSNPDSSNGYYGRNEGFLLCSDGYRHFMAEDAMREILGYDSLRGKTQEDIQKRLQEIGKRNMRKGETDNMSAIYTRRAYA